MVRITITPLQKRITIDWNLKIQEIQFNIFIIKVHFSYIIFNAYGIIKFIKLQKIFTITHHTEKILPSKSTNKNKSTFQNNSEAMFHK